MSSLAELNALVDQWDIEDEARRIGARPRTIGEHLAVERPLLKPVPDESFETGLTLSLRVLPATQDKDAIPQSGRDVCVR
ncbi:hypothetical protein [Actinomadura rudentiformis]|uniref:hypothetical protein n=1 Tax=Actinomadura rudentiformis TaxID=359158 RepID=UPI001CEF94BF|nr:hypothetical protein [Actinomadura rudentiformis]